MPPSPYTPCGRVVQVKLYLWQQEVVPGRTVRLMVRAAPLSTVFLLGQRSRLTLDDGHDITLSQV